MSIDNNKLYKAGYTQGREISWLHFNNRVLDEAKLERVPLLERLNFFSIYHSNLNEYFMIRVGSLNALKLAEVNDKDECCGLTAAKQLDQIYDYTHKQATKVTKIYLDLIKSLRKEGIIIKEVKDCNYEQQKQLNKYFNTSVKPLLLPRVVNSHHPLPILASGVIHIIVRLGIKEKENIGIIPIPDTLPALVSLNSKTNDEFVFLEDLLLSKVETLFDKGNVIESGIFMITRNGDINPEDSHEYPDDYRKKIKKVLGKRRSQEVVRLVMNKDMGVKLVKYLTNAMKVDKKQIYSTVIPMNYKFGFELPSMIKNIDKTPLTYPSYTPKLTTKLDYTKPLFDQIYDQDLLLHYPYESMDPFLRLIKESSRDPQVVSIKITIYRLAKNAKLVEYLCEAAENGKEVVVLIELKARFDEQHNIDYSQRLEEAGCVIMYGFDEYKVHSKICQITRLNGKKVESITQIGTGNYNEKTVRLYTDFAYLTSNTRINKDANNFFNNMLVGNLEGHYTSLMVAPNELKDHLIELIDAEAKKGSEGKIIIKMNSLNDVDLIRHLHMASSAGVSIDLIIRGICCLLPGIEGKTDNIHIHSIIGRYLEHSRVYSFGKGEDNKLYIASADFMKRNTEKRVEIACPIYDETIKAGLHSYLEACLKDNVGGRAMNAKGNLVKIKEGASFNSQEYFMNVTQGEPEGNTAVKKGKVINSFKTKLPKKKK